MKINIRFYTDENVENQISVGLRTRQIDVITTPEAGTMGFSDAEHVAFALAERRVIITQDADFIILASQGMEHAGIVYYKPQSRTTKQIIRGLLRLYEQLSAEDMLNRVEYV
jgi:predicted nuclease of predicted toxin-antitoxin system